MKQKTFQGLIFIFLFFTFFIVYHRINMNPKVIIQEKPIAIPTTEQVIKVDRQRIEDKLVPPERRVPPLRQNINIRTRGQEPFYQKVGILYKDGRETLPLFGRPTYYGSDEYDYYVIDSSRNFNKIPLENIRREIMDGQTVTLPISNEEYKAMIYEPEELRYIPYV